MINLDHIADTAQRGQPVFIAPGHKLDRLFAELLIQALLGQLRVMTHLGLFAKEHIPADQRLSIIKPCTLAELHKTEIVVKSRRYVTVTGEVGENRLKLLFTEFVIATIRL